jgi:hypothetical protein
MDCRKIGENDSTRENWLMGLLDGWEIDAIGKLQ